MVYWWDPVNTTSFHIILKPPKDFGSEKTPNCVNTLIVKSYLRTH